MVFFSVLSVDAQPLSMVEGLLAPLQPYSFLQPVKPTGSSQTITKPLLA